MPLPFPRIVPALPYAEQLILVQIGLQAQTNRWLARLCSLLKDEAAVTDVAAEQKGLDEFLAALRDAK